MAELREERQMRQAAIVRAYKRVFETESGKMMIEDLMKQFPPSRPRFSPVTDFDPIKAAVADGQSQVTLHILEVLARPVWDDETAAAQPAVSVIKE